MSKPIKPLYYNKGKIEHKIDTCGRRQCEEMQGKDGHPQARERGLEQTFPSQPLEEAISDLGQLKNCNCAWIIRL